MKYLSVLLFGFILACSQGNTSGGNMISKEKSYAVEDANFTEQFNTEYVKEDPVVPSEVKQKIIKTARLAFETKDPGSVHEKILRLTKDHQGFIQSDHSGKDYGRINFNIVVRVPTENFQNMIDGVSEGQ